MQLNQVVIIGAGLIGGSLAQALRRADACGRITAVGRNPEHLRRAVELGVVDDYHLEPAAAADADLVVLATPLSTTGPLLQQVAPVLGSDTVVTDVGSVKGSVVATAREVLGDAFPRFVPGHPIAGTEKSGVEASFAELFDDHLVILTPEAETGDGAMATVRWMWEQCGARVVITDVVHHDRVLAATSHLPHMLAFALVECLAGMGEREEIFRFAAGGFRDFTRIASSNPAMWQDICLANREQLLAAVDAFQVRLSDVRAAVAGDDRERLLDIFNRAKRARDGFIHQRGGQKALDASE